MIYHMATDRVSHIVAQYEAGALTEGAACLEVLLAAGTGDAHAVFDGLPPELRAAVARDVKDADPDQSRILESHCGTGPAEAYAADLRRREELMRPGIIALRRVINARSGGG